MEKVIHKDAAREMWKTTNGTYEKVRPSHDRAAVQYLLRQLGVLDNDLCNQSPPFTYAVLDVGAGTGKCTSVIKDILREDARIAALDPVAGMLEQLKAVVPGVDTFVSPCESIPLPDNSVKAVVSSQSFHFIANVTALREINRILVPGGKFGILFSVDDEASPLVHDVFEVMRKYKYPGCPEFFINTLQDTSWQKCFGEAPLFTPLQEHVMPWEKQDTLPDVESVVQLFMTFSATAREPEVREECAESMRRLLAANQTVKQNGGQLEVPRLSALYWCTKNTVDN
ncbi:Hypp7740 [Branchiostoma lanceolatum]|uniref:Hypp7740 protein n=1 Tax=Branchiostoma lanceolatum TaxID=7740 RepID=A0A8J9Z3L9_BRALA|nr:Hypp7740 [Branchiostoma lanceolatum]